MNPAFETQVDESMLALGDGVHHRLTLLDSAGSLAIGFQVGIHQTGASFAAVVQMADAAPIILAETEIQRPQEGFELRASGLWADHVCEAPMEHWSYGLEAFALAVDDPAELLNRGFGDRVPLGWELEFEASDLPRETSVSSYYQSGVGHGLLLFKTGEVAVSDLLAVRQHWWGDPDEASVDIVSGEIGAPFSGRQDDGLTQSKFDQNTLDQEMPHGAEAIALPLVKTTWWFEGLISHPGTPPSSPNAMWRSSSLK